MVTLATALAPTTVSIGDAPAEWNTYVDAHPDAKFAVTHYRTIASAGPFSMLEVTLETGRKNQIRAHLSEAGHPVVRIALTCLFTAALLLNGHAADDRLPSRLSDREFWRLSESLSEADRAGGTVGRARRASVYSSVA